MGNANPHVLCLLFIAIIFFSSERPLVGITLSPALWVKCWIASPNILFSLLDVSIIILTSVYSSWNQHIYFYLWMASRYFVDPYMAVLFIFSHISPKFPVSDSSFSDNSFPSSTRLPINVILFSIHSKKKSNWQTEVEGDPMAPISIAYTKW